MKRIVFLLSSLLVWCFAFAQTRPVTGVVLDSASKPVTAATVQVRGTTTTTVTDAEGRFSIAVPAGQATLEVTSIGYAGATTSVAPGTNSVTVTLSGAAQQLNEVVVTALGIRREQRKLGYATATISAQDIIKTAPTNFASALYGKAPGVTINTNPGGATSAVSVQIRGLSSINFQRQPLLVVDGVVVRNGDANNEGYWGGNQRINANGLLDINPENIANITVLKGAAASALYGSDANFGVIVITTKNGQGRKGLGIDVNLSGNMEQVSVVPDLQTEYGPGYDRGTNTSAFGSDEDGWLHTTLNEQDVVSPIFRAYGQFGPKVDGRDVYWWDGQMRPYVAHSNPWKDFYRTGYSTVANVAVNNATDKMNYRLSYTRNDYQGVQVGGKQQKNTFNLNSTYKITPKLTTDIAISYVNEKVHNRPRQIDRITNNYGGFFSPVDYMDLYFDKYQTTKGYKYVRYDQPDRDPAEAIKYNIRAYDFMDFLWTQLQNNYDESSNRLIGSATVNYNFIKDFNFRGRFGTDYTGYYLEEKDKNEYPIAFGPSGYYGTASNRYLFTYGDVLLSYSKQLFAPLKLNASVGYQARKEDYRYNSASTSSGLTTENWFSLKASATTPTPGSSSRSFLVKDGLFGILGLEYNNYLFLEGTVRRERTSTLYPGRNTFYYPGVSAAFELSNALHLPAFVSYSKLRAAWGTVGNPPNPYYSNITYTAGNINGIPTLYPQSSYGNENLKNEEKHELEFGWETRLFNSRFGFDVSYYNNKIKNQILNLTTPGSIGATGIIVNVGDLRNYGLEASLNGTPIRSKNFQWDTRLNLAFNRNKIVALMPGLERLTNTNIDNGSLLVVSEVGQPAGDIVGYKRRVNESGQYVINSDGYYDINFDDQVKMGNIQPKGSGGFINNLNYKNFGLSVLVDFRWGGQVISPSLLYGTGAGLYENSMFGRDAEHGGVAYYVDASTNTYVKTTGNTGPNGEKVYHDGIVLSGVTTEGKANETIIDAANYYLNTYTWGSWPGSGSYSTYEGAVFDNDFVKLRELSLSYTMPLRVRSKLSMQNLTFSLYGRNLFYFYKALPYLDPEEGVGTNFVSQAIVGGGTAATRSYGASIRVSF